MAPSREFYQKHSQFISPQGSDVERTEPLVLQWLSSQLPEQPKFFIVKVFTKKTPLWGAIDVGSLTYGDGSLVLPISLNGCKVDYPGLRWMISENQKTFGASNFAPKMFRSLQLKFNTQYDRCRTQTSGSGFSGVDYALVIERSIGYRSSGEPWREMPNAHRYTPEIQAKLTVSAMGIASVINEDMPTLYITPAPSEYIKSPQMPR
jgi:hypothetical protein